MQTLRKVPMSVLRHQHLW